MYTPGIQPVIVSCFTSNCTWPTFPTIAVCSSTNVKANITESCSPYSYGEPQICSCTLPNDVFVSGNTTSDPSPVMDMTCIMRITSVDATASLSHKSTTYPESHFWTGESVIFATQLKLADLFTGNAEAGAGTGVFSSDAMQAVWGAGDPSSWVQDIALSITNHFSYGSLKL